MKLNFIFCPPTADIAKTVSKYLGIMSDIRKEIDMGLKPQDLSIYINPISYGGGLGGPPLAEFVIAPKRIYISL